MGKHSKIPRTYRHIGKRELSDFFKEKKDGEVTSPLAPREIPREARKMTQYQKSL